MSASRLTNRRGANPRRRPRLGDGERLSAACTVAATLITTLMASPCFANNLECRKFQKYGGALNEGLERPHAPTCVDGLMPPVDDYNHFEFQDCLSQIENYRAEVNDYLSCLKSESREALSGLNSLIDRFNCKARGSSC